MSRNHSPEPLGRDGLRQKYVGAAGGRIVIPPYPAANELSGIYVTKSARGVEPREVKSRFDYSRPLVPTLCVSLDATLFKPARKVSRRRPAIAATVSPQQDRKSSFTL